MEYISSEPVRDMTDIENIIEDYNNGIIKAGDEIEIKGSIHRLRLMSGFAFVVLRTPRRLFQCVYTEGESGFDIAELVEEACVIVRGTVVADERSALGFELHLTGVRTLSKPAEMLPIIINKKKVGCSIDLLLDNRAITLRNPKERAILKIADGVLLAFREFLHGEGFTEFVAPKIVKAGAEGGADMFELDYFGQKAYLAQSPQMYKQLMVGVFTKVFTLSPVFRAEKHSTSRHINEFQGLDLEVGYLESLDDLMAIECRLMAYIYKTLRESYALELAELDVTLPEKIETIPKIKFMDAKNLIAEVYKRPYRDPNDLEPDEERLIGKYFLEKYQSPFVFVTHYPEKKRPFYTMNDPEDPKYTLSFDLLLNGAEVTTGGRRIHDYHEQVAKMERRGMDIEDFSDYLMMHKYGLPPHGGMGIGLERLVMRILNLDNIKYATAFPRDTGRLNP